MSGQHRATAEPYDQAAEVVGTALQLTAGILAARFRDGLAGRAEPVGDEWAAAAATVLELYATGRTPPP